LVADPAVPLNFDEILPVIDRLESFIAMGTLIKARGKLLDDDQLLKCVEPFAGVPDVRIANLMATFGRPVASPANQAAAATADEVLINSSGRDDSGNPLTMALTACDSGELLDGRDFRGELAEAVTSVIMSDEQSESSIDKLSKVILDFAGRPLSDRLDRFLSTVHVPLVAEEPTERSKMIALSTPLLEDSGYATLFEIVSSEVISSAEMSAGHVLAVSLARKLIDPTAPDVSTEISAHRSLEQKGYREWRSANFVAAASCFLAAAEASPSVMRLTYIAYACWAHLRAGRAEDCIEIAAQELLENPYSQRALPIAQIAAGLPSRLAPTLPLALVYYNAAKHVSPVWYRQLSDVVDNILDAADVSTPSEYLEKFKVLSPIELVFFRDISVPRVLEETAIFPNLSKIEEERIRLCSVLSTIDPDHEESYAHEIRTLTRATQVANLMSAIESGKIFVDELGLQSTLDPVLRGMFARLLRASAAPTLAARSDRIIQQLKDLLGESAGPVLSNVRQPASEVDTILLDILDVYVGAFSKSPAFGLDTFLSSGIRHGAFEGYLLRPLAAVRLLVDREMGGASHDLDPYWDAKLVSLTASERTVIQKALSHFTKRVTEIELAFRSDQIRIRGDEHPNGLFDFSDDVGVEAFVATGRTVAALDDLLPQLSAFCWAKTSASLEIVQAELRTQVQQRINAQIDLLTSTLDRDLPHSDITPLRDAIVIARTHFQTAADVVAGWFRRPTELVREDYEFDLAIDVAAKQIENCYPRHQLNIVRLGETGVRFEGETFDAFVEILFVVLQNVVRRSGFTGSVPDVRLLLERQGGDFVLQVDNELAGSIDIPERKAAGRAAVERYEEDTALSMARQDAGSGLSKVWRTFQYSLDRRHGMTIDVTDDSRFILRLRFNSDGLEA